MRSESSTDMLHSCSNTRPRHWPESIDDHRGPPTPPSVPSGGLAGRRVLGRSFHLDHLGSPRIINDANGTTLAQHLYFPWLSPDANQGFDQAFGDLWPLSVTNWRQQHESHSKSNLRLDDSDENVHSRRSHV